MEMHNASEQKRQITWAWNQFFEKVKNFSTL